MAGALGSLRQWQNGQRGSVGGRMFEALSSAVIFASRRVPNILWSLISHYAATEDVLKTTKGDCILS
jgi:hypothetical protein